MNEWIIGIEGKVYGGGGGGGRGGMGRVLDGLNAGIGWEGVRKVCFHSSWVYSQQAGRVNTDVVCDGGEWGKVADVCGSDIRRCNEV